jgi:hypothetical protein
MDCNGWALALVGVLTVGCTATPDEAQGLTFDNPGAPQGVSGGGTDGDDDPRSTDGPATGGESASADGTDAGDATATDGSADGSDDASMDGPTGACTPGDSADCYSGPPNTENVGECASGVQSCQSDGTWGACTAEVLPTTEQCNDLDDDCNAVVDDGDPGGGAACQTGQPGPCAAGILACNGGLLECEPNVAPVVEVCGDGIDNDCSGAADDGCNVACDPMNPGPACGAGQQCMPSVSGVTSCQGPVGGGTQYTNCLSDTDCGPGLVCVDTGLGSVYCMEWCTSYLQCPYVLDDCVALAPSVYAGAQEYGVCYDGFP